jgi:hypothetical protein
MKAIWKEKITVGSHEVARYDEEDARVSRYEQAIQVRAKAWYDKKTRTLRIDLECILVNRYDWHSAEGTWDELAPVRALHALEPMTMAAIYRMIAGAIDDYETEATQRYLALDLADRRSDEEVKEAHFATC